MSYIIREISKHNSDLQSLLSLVTWVSPGSRSEWRYSSNPSPQPPPRSGAAAGRRHHPGPWWGAGRGGRESRGCWSWGQTGTRLSSSAQRRWRWPPAGGNYWSEAEQLTGPGLPWERPHCPRDHLWEMWTGELATSGMPRLPAHIVSPSKYILLQILGLLKIKQKYFIPRFFQV